LEDVSAYRTGDELAGGVAEETEADDSSCGGGRKRKTQGREERRKNQVGQDEREGLDVLVASPFVPNS
jgi:hypothetical protein